MQSITIPDGYILQKRGGRPTKETKYIAVVLARLWRRHFHKEKAYVTDAWILEKWENHGITDEAHIRRIIRDYLKDKNAPLYGAEIFMNIQAASATSKDGDRVWYWDETRHIAMLCRVRRTLETAV